MTKIAKVAIVSSLPQLNRLFDYSIPDELADSIVFGVRVRVQFGRSSKLLEGFVVEVAAQSDYSGKLSPIAELVSPLPVLTQEVLSLCNQVAERAASNLGELLKLAIPSHMPRSYEAFLKAEIQSPATPEQKGKTSVKLSRGSRIAIIAEPKVRALEGNTKTTPVWAQQFASIAADFLSKSESVLILVPDFREHDAAIESLVEAGLSDFLIDYSQDQPKSKRYLSFLRILGKSPVVVVGLRSASFAPLVNLGAILVWDEADPSYTDQGAPYVNAREVVLVRQQLTDCALVFSSHSRSTDIQRLIELQYLNDLDSGFSHPKVAVSDHGFRIDSLAHSAIKNGLAKGPVLVQVASKGQSTSLHCSKCDAPAVCRTCAGPLWTDSEGKIRCRWCNAFQLDFKCVCGSAKLTSGRAGSTRTASELGRAFPNVAVIEATGEKKISVLPKSNTLVIATAGAEPYVDGGYSAVVVLDAQVMLSRQSLRAQENTVREWSNAIAKLGIGGSAVLVGISGHLGQRMALWQQRELASEELEARRELGLPPAVRLGSLSGELDYLTAIKAELSKTKDLVLLGPAPELENGVQIWRLMFKYPYSNIASVANLLRAVVAKATSGQVSVSKSGRSKRSVQIRMSDAEVI